MVTETAHRRAEPPLAVQVRRLRMTVEGRILELQKRPATPATDEHVAHLDRLAAALLAAEEEDALIRARFRTIDAAGTEARDRALAPAS